jgi:hypothetical protein
VKKLLVGLILLPSQALLAQTMEIRLRDQTTLAPVAGAIVRLLDDRGTVAQGLSSESGWLVLRGTGAGSYRLKVDRIGWAGVIAGPFVLAEGETLRRELHLSSARIDLPPLSVEGESRCNRTSQGGALAVALWEEIRKALTANLISNASESPPLHIREFSRDVDLAGRPIHEHLTMSRIARGKTYTALAPAELAQGGFIFPKGDRTMYAAPDAQSLLSDAFVASHCFRAVPGTGVLVGLAFEPVRDRKVIDVSGTLWVNRLTSELDFLEYRYTRLPDYLARGDLGGRVAFQRLATGAWIVSSWHIRRPQLLREEIVGAGNTSRFRVKAVAYHERGARVEMAEDSAGRPTRAVVFGEIWDSIAGKGLENAIVYIEGQTDSIATDSAGRYQLVVAATGPQMVAARHRRVGLLALPSKREVTLFPGDTAVVDFTVPSLPTVARALCGPGWMLSGLAGILFSADTTPAIGFDLRTAWRTPTGGRQQETAQSGARGIFAFCGELPSDQELRLRVYAGKRPLMDFPVRVPPNGTLWVELRMVDEAKPQGRDDAK